MLKYDKFKRLCHGAIYQKITFNLDTESTDKTRTIFKNAGTALVKKNILMLDSKAIDTTNKPDIYDTYKQRFLLK